MAAAPGVGVVGSYSAPSDMKHNGLRKRLDILGFTQPLPLGAVPLVGAILEDLIRTTESLKAHKDHVHNLLQEKKAWDLGVEAYKCDNSKLLAEVSHLNKELIRQKDHYEAKKCDLSRRIRNLEMDKKYLEDHLQEMGERCEELEGKYQDLLDPKRKASRRPFVSTVRSGHIIPPQRDQHQQQCGHLHPMAGPPCPSRCPASARRKDLELDRDRLHRDSLTLQEQIEAQSKQCHATTWPTCSPTTPPSSSTMANQWHNHHCHRAQQPHHHHHHYHPRRRSSSQEPFNTVLPSPSSAPPPPIATTASPSPLPPPTTVTLLPSPPNPIPQPFVATPDEAQSSSSSVVVVEVAKKQL